MTGVQTCALPIFTALINDKGAENDLKSIFEEQYGCSKGKAASMLKELRKSGETSVPMDGPERSYPVLRAFNLDENLFIPSFSLDLERVPGIYRVEYFTAEQLRQAAHWHLPVVLQEPQHVQLGHADPQADHPLRHRRGAAPA